MKKKILEKRNGGKYGNKEKNNRQQGFMQLGVESLI